MIPRVTLLVTALVAAGCGARSELASSSGAGGASSSSTTTAITSSSTSTSGGGGSGGGAGGNRCTWGFGPKVEVVARREYIAGAVSEEQDLLVFSKFQNTAFSRSLSFDLTDVGTKQTLPLETEQTFPPVFAAGFGHTAAISSNEFGGCRALALDAGANPLDTQTYISMGDNLACAAVVATPSGYFVFAGQFAGTPAFVSAPLDVVVLDAGATLAVAKPDIVPPPSGISVSRLASAVLDDGSIAIFWSVSASMQIFGQRFDAHGDPLTGAKALLPAGFWIAAFSLGSSILLAWNEGSGSESNNIQMATLDSALNLDAAHVVVAAPSQEHVIALVDGGPAPGRLLVTDPGVDAQGYGQPAIARWVSDAGAAIGPAFESKIPVEGLFPVVVATPSGPVAFGAHSAQRVVCQ